MSSQLILIVAERFGGSAACDKSRPREDHYDRGQLRGTVSRSKGP